MRTMSMRPLRIAGALTLALLLSVAGCKGDEGGKKAKGAAAPASEDYGEGVADPDDLTPIPSITKAPAEYDGKIVTVRGVIASVCPSAGCFLFLGEGAAQIKIDMHPNGFNVPPGKGGGQVAWATGKVLAGKDTAVIIATGVRVQEKKEK